MTAISKDTAMEIALAYREVETAEAFLADILKGIKETHDRTPDIRDAFGRRREGLELGVPSGESSRRCYHVPWSMCKPILETHIAHHRARIELLTEKAREEMGAP